MTTMEQVQQTIQACFTHARDLLRAARRLLEDEKLPNVGYHLSVLALEEIGKATLVGTRHIARLRDADSTFIDNRMDDHVFKLFWALWMPSFARGNIFPEELEMLRGLAKDIHSRRLEAMYVSPDANVSAPLHIIDDQSARRLLRLTEARLGMEDSRDWQTIDTGANSNAPWFLDATADPMKLRLIFGQKSIDKLGELGNIYDWITWLREQFERAESDARAATEEEIRRAVGKGLKKKWKLRIRISTASHSIRPKLLSIWNRKVDSIKLISTKKNELIIEFILHDNVPIQALWYFGWSLARHFVVALNIGTMGFWWWRMPEQISKYYESIEDLDRGQKVSVERAPSLKIDWGENRVLNEEDLNRVMTCWAALPEPAQRDQHVAYDHYIGGLTFLSLNDVHWQCESTVFGNFFESLRAMMDKAGDWRRDTPFEAAFARFLDELFPEMDERDRFIGICRAFESKSTEGVRITLQEASFMKLFCDAYFLAKIRRAALEAKLGSAVEDMEPSGSQEE